MSEQELPQECCAKCRFHFYGHINPETKKRECRRRAPVANAVGHAMFPVVAKEDWCGEFQPRQEKPAAAPEPSEYELPLSSLGLPSRIHNQLLSNGVETVGELCRTQPVDLRLTYVPDTWLRAVVEALDKIGLSMPGIKRPSDRSGPLDVTLDACGLSFRAVKALVREVHDPFAVSAFARVVTVGDVSSVTIRKLQAAKNCGADTVAEIKTFFETMGHPLAF